MSGRGWEWEELSEGKANQRGRDQDGGRAWWGWVSGLCSSVLQGVTNPAPQPAPPPPRPAPHPLQVACCLEVDEVGLPGLKRWVPEATIGMVVTHGEGHGLRQTAGRQFGPEVVHQASGQRRIEGQRHWEAVLAAWLPPESPRPLLLHNNLVHTGHGGGGGGKRSGHG